jgi:CysZ protein
MLRALSLSIEQLGDGAILRVLAKSLLITITLFGVFGLGVFYGVDALLDTYGWGDADGQIATLIAGIIWTLAFIFLFRAVAVPVIGFFADDVVAAVERKHYPSALTTARPASVVLSLRLGLMSVVRLVLVNLALLPLYAALLLTAVGPFALFLVANGLLLGRDLGEMVAVRHLGAMETQAWLRSSRLSRALLGLVVTGIFMVPVANVFAPIIGAAMATHVFHVGRRPASQMTKRNS